MKSESISMREACTRCQEKGSERKGRGEPYLRVRGEVRGRTGKIESLFTIFGMREWNTCGINVE